MRCILLLPLLLAGGLSAQLSVVRWAYGPFATPGDAAYVIDGTRVHQSAGPYGSRGPCIYVLDLQEEQVFHSADAFGRRGAGAFFADGESLVRCSGALCSRGSCVFTVERDPDKPGMAKVFRAGGNACFKAEGAFLIEGSTVYLAEGAFGMKGDALFAIEGDVPLLALLAILAGY